VKNRIRFLVGICVVCFALAGWFLIPERKPVVERIPGPDWYDSAQRTHFLDTVSLRGVFEIKDLASPENWEFRKWMDSLALGKDGKGLKPDYGFIKPLPLR
jgi:hypothetical protein